MNNTPSFLDAAITDGCMGKSSFAKVARLVENRDEPHFANRIGGAWASLVNERNQLRILDKEDNSARVKDMPVKPEMFLSLCQYLLNQACWAARRYIRAQQANNDQEAIMGITGIDFSQDVAADLGVEPMNFEAVEQSLEDDFAAMLKLHSVLATKMNYLDNIEELYLYAEREQEGEVWRITGTAMNYQDASILMDEILTKMNERADKELSTDMITTDFTS